MTVKLIRLARRAVTDAGLRTVSCENVVGHYRFILELPDGSQRKLTLPSSPRAEEHALMYFKKYLQQMLATPPNHARKARP